MKRISIFLMMAFLAVFTYAETNIYAPTLLSPATGAGNQIPSVMLDWSAVPGAWSYKVEVSTDTNFTNPIVFNTSFTAAVNSELEFGTVYYWHVKAYGTSDSSAWSDRWAFTVIDLVTITEPLDSAMYLFPITNIKWTAISGVAGYDWEVDSVITFDSPLYRTATLEAPEVSAFTSQLNFGQQYFLRMRAHHASDTSSWSPAIMFNTIDTISMKRPVENSDTLYAPVFELRFGYIKSQYYDVAFDMDSLMSAPQIVTVDSGSVTENNVHVVQYAKANSAVLMFNSTYFWTVRARNDFDTMAWMPVRKFMTDSIVHLSNPGNDTIGTSTLPTFKWLAMGGTDNYILQYDTDSNFSAPMEVTDSLINYTPTIELLPFTKYFWRVQSMTTVDTSLWSEVWNLTTASGVGVEEQGLRTENIFLYPNPCKGKLNIEIESSGISTVRIELNNILGQTLSNELINLKAGRNYHQLNLNQFVNGIYLVKIQNGDNSITRKVILDR